MVPGKKWMPMGSRVPGSGQGQGHGDHPAQAWRQRYLPGAFPQSPSHLFSCCIFEDPTSCKGVMLEDRGTRMNPVTQQRGGVPSPATSSVSSVVAPGEACGDPGWVSGGSGLLAFIFPPPNLPSFPSFLDLWDGVRHEVHLQHQPSSRKGQRARRESRLPRG